MVEALVAVAIFAFVIIAPLRIAVQSLIASTSVKDQIIAIGLARDAIEYINYRREENALSGIEWTAGLFNASFNDNTMCGSNSGCQVDTSVSPGTIVINTNVPLRLDPATGRYGYNANWPVTKYTRVIKVVGIEDGHSPEREIRVEVKVSWNISPTVTKTVNFTQYLFNWIKEEKLK